MAGMLERLNAAVNAHDPVRLAAMFAEDYRSAQPAHPDRAFTGRAQLQAHWAAMFAEVPDIESDLLASSVQATGDTDSEWGEWYWHGRSSDGTAFAMRGMTVMVVRDDLVVEGRLYVEPVETGG